MKLVNQNDYFVYQNWTDEKIYSKGLSYEDAERDFNALNRLIESGSCGNGCACIGRLYDPADYLVAMRLGLIKYTLHIIQGADGIYIHETDGNVALADGETVLFSHERTEKVNPYVFIELFRLCKKYGAESKKAKDYFIEKTTKNLSAI